ncbi:AraC family transcriptional regulator [Flavobacterium keumense]|uniref:AraC family transcriptional regulator n=2 Tax=Flavobacterium TaxID=237 RepID=A0ABY8N8C8_9FLAO|nr:AraC family transcriptional regulator [Flavobacterium keumense]WGK95101.1 AraC family transcriptional regulator [Flavobacterium keumense]
MLTQSIYQRFMEMLTPFFGIFTSFILFYYRKDFNRSNLYLALFFLCSNLIVLVYFGLHFSKSPFWEGVFFVNFMPLSFVIGPLLFYYVKYAVAENKNITPKDYLHLFPAVVVILYSLPYTTLPFSKKVEIAHHIQAVTQDYDFSISFFSLKKMLFIRPLHLFIYCVLSWGYFKQTTKKRLASVGVLPTHHSMIQKWIYSLIGLQSFIASYCLLDSYADFILNDYQGIINQKNYFRFLGVAFSLQNVILFLFPKILFDTISYPDASLARNRATQLKKGNAVEINQNITTLLDKYMVACPFILPGFNLSKMALDLQVSERILSNYFNTELKISFSEWKNNQRIDYACKLIEEGKATKLTVEGISQNVGFSSRSKFIDAFKERKGVVPSTYIKQFS